MKVKFPLLHRYLRWFGVGLVAFVIVYFSIVTTPSKPPEAGPFWDKKLHFISYAGLTLAVAYATAKYRNRTWQRIGLVILLVVTFSGVIELLQGVIPYRYASPLDFIANVLGVLIGSLWFPIERYLDYKKVKTLEKIGELGQSEGQR